MVKPNLNKENLIKAGVGVALGAALIGSCSYSWYCGNQKYKGLLAEAEAEAAAVEKVVYDFDVEEKGFDFSSVPYRQMGYSNIQDYWDVTQWKRDSIKGIADEYIDAYGSKMTEDDKTNLRWYESCMLNAVYTEDFDDAKQKFNDYVSQFVPKQSYSGGGGGYYSSDPYNFKFHGVLYDSNYRYTYYSSNVLRHYKTSQWTLGSDGIYRDSNGRVIVASDDYAQGTVVNSEIFGECIVEDCGVGSSGTLDVYTGF